MGKKVHGFNIFCIKIKSADSISTDPIELGVWREVHAGDGNYLSSGCRQHVQPWAWVRRSGGGRPRRQNVAHEGRKQQDLGPRVQKRNVLDHL